MLIFAVTTLVVSWGWWGMLIYWGATVTVGAWPTHFPGLLGPAIGALVAAGATGRPTFRRLVGRLARWRISGLGWLLALVPLLVALLTVPVARLLTGTWPALDDLGRVSGLPPVTGGWVPVLVAVVFVVDGIGEELGWRGWLQPALAARWGTPRATIVTWLAWTLWHAPLFVVVATFRGLIGITLLGWLMGLACASVVAAWLMRRTDSVPALAAWHTAYTMAAGTAAAGGLFAATSTAAIIVWAVLILGAWAIRKSRGSGPTVR